MTAMGPPPPTSPVKPPLITPSASPPPARLPYRMSDSASPTKRQRLHSTPCRTPSEASSSASRPQFPEDVQKEREASKMRLFDVWSSLAERYTVPVEEDDIVNIQTGEITRDNGYLRKSRKLDFGAIAAPTLGNIAADDSSEDEEDEYDLDELDAFADDVSESSHHEAETQADADLPERVMPPATVLNAADAEDLRDFMNAERQRRELCGSDLDDDEEEGYSSTEIDHTGTRTINEGSGILGATERVMSGEEDEDEQGAEEEESPVASEVEERMNENERVPQNLDRPVPLDLISEDELDNWNVDDASVVHPIVKPEQTSDHGHSDTDSEVEIIEDTAKSHIIEQSHTQKSPTKSYLHSQIHKPLQQLFTPPLSHSSSRPSATPISDVIDLSREPSPPRSPSVRAKTSNTQLNTPRNNKRFISTPRDVQNTPVRHMDLSQLAKGKGKSSPLKHSPEVSLKSPTKSAKTKPKTQAFVLLTPRQGSSPHKADAKPSAASTDRDVNPRNEVYEHDNISPSKLSKGKGKATEPVREAKRPENRHTSAVSRTGKARRQTKHDPTSSNNESDLEFILIESSPSKPPRFGVPRGKPGTTKPTPKGTKTPNGKTALPIHELGEASRSRQSDSPPPRSSPILRKRKRVFSDANSDFSDGALQNPKTASSPQKSDRSSTHPSTSRIITDNESKPQKPKKRSSSRRRHTSTDSDSNGGYRTESSESESGDHYRRSKSHSRVNASLPPLHHPYHNMSYPPSHYPPQDYQPLPDPRAQLIISQAMQQLSALVGTAWALPHHYMDGSLPSTPHRHHDGRPVNGPFITPTHHPHSYPYAYDPNLSNATLPPDSPEYNSSPSKSISGRRKSLVGRSRSRGRRVSFNIEQDKQHQEEMEMGGYSSPTSMRLSKGSHRGDSSRGDEGTKKTGGQKQKREKTPGRRFKSLDDDESDIQPEVERRSRGYARGQTPGPSLDRKEGSSGGRASTSKRHEKR